MNKELDGVTPDHVFDVGDLDCGSGLILLIRENMLKVSENGILEMRSREPSVAEDLPPWCRMSGHKYLGMVQAPGYKRYFIRRGKTDEEDKLSEDKEKAKAYVWRARARSTGYLKSTVYCRNFSFEVGQQASFEEKDKYPCAVEYLLGALAGALTSGFSTECAKDNLNIDDIEITINGKLINILSHLGLEEGDPSFEMIEIKCFASTFDDEGKVTEAWERTIVRSPIITTLKKATDISLRLSIV